MLRNGGKLQMTFLFTDGGDLYVWGWNESGQLGLPSQALRKTQQHSSQKAGWPIFSHLSARVSSHTSSLFYLIRFWRISPGISASKGLSFVVLTLF